MGLAVTTVASGGLPVKELAGGGIAVTEVASYGLAVTKVAGAGAGLGVTFVSATGGPVTPAFATWNPADLARVTLSNGNLTAVTTGVAPTGVRGVTAKSSGKYYFEVTMTDWSGTSANIGVGTSSAVFGAATNAGTAVVSRSQGGINGSIYTNGTYTGSSLGIGVNNGVVIGIAVDISGSIWFRIAPTGNWNGSAGANPSAPTGGLGLGAIAGASLFPYYGAASVQNGITANFGASAFVGAVPSGFTAGWPA